jgi:hypothetical protein
MCELQAIRKQNGAKRHFLLPDDWAAALGGDELVFDLERHEYRGSGKREHKGVDQSGKCNASDWATPVAT